MVNSKNPEGQVKPDSATTANGRKIKEVKTKKKEMRCPNCGTEMNREDFGFAKKQGHPVGTRYECPECGLIAQQLRYPKEDEPSLEIIFDPRKENLLSLHDDYSEDSFPDEYGDIEEDYGQALV